MEKEAKLVRCKWCSNDPIYQQYHDTEWGVPKYDDHTLFEMLILEGAQAGLSWITILKRRKNYRKAFDDFNVHRVAQYTARSIERLLDDKGIIRNKLKIDSAIKNAKTFMNIQNEFGSFSRYIWDYVGHKPHINYYMKHEDVPILPLLLSECPKILRKEGCLLLALLSCIHICNLLEW